MWTFRPPMTGEDELRAELKAERRDAKAIIRDGARLVRLLKEAQQFQNDLAEEVENRDKMIGERDEKIEGLETLVRLRELELRGLTEINERNRQRVEAEAAVEVARAEAAALIRGNQQQQGSYRAFIP